MEKGSSSSSVSSSSSDSLNGLMFGKKIYFEGVGSEAAPLPSPAKKGRVSAVQSGQPPRCQVEGCKVDLSDAKAYYSRHKVCGIHSKSPKVIVAGLEQRFCQQCSRFHNLAEFDQGKRSCRRRLAGHNERRRKPPPGSLSYPRYDRSKTGGFVMDFSSYPSHPWPNASSERGMGSQAKHDIPLQSNSHSHNPLSDLLQGITTTPRSNYSTTPLASPNGYFNGVSDSSYALSLLSTHPWGSRTTRSMGLGSSSFLGAQPSVNHGQFAALHEMPPDLGLGQTSHVPNHFTGELGLAQPEEGHFNELDCSRGYDASLQHMHWSL